MFGLINIGNTCFANAVLQCLFNIDIFVSQIKKHSNTKISNDLLNIYNNNSYENIIVFFNFLKNKLNLGEQHDSHEFLSLLLNSIHNENKSFKQFSIRQNLIKSNNKNDEKNLFNFLKSLINHHHKEHISFITTLFENYIITINTCKSCNHSSFIYVYDNIVQLYLKPQSVNFTDILNYNFNTTELLSNNKYSCSNCKSFTNCDRNTKFFNIGEILCFHLCLFTNNKKININLEFPENLNMNNYIFNNSIIKQNNLYSLSGIVFHSGSLNGGHYIAGIKHNNEWYICDDSNVYKINKNNLNFNNAYLLFYIRSK